MKTRYVAFLRGINVGGHNVSMEHLRGLISDLGLSEVRSYIQTGNIFFDAESSDQHGLSQKVYSLLEAKLGYRVPTFVLTIDELEHIINAAPFGSIELTDDTRHMIVFINKPLPQGTSYPLLSPKGDFEVVGATDDAAYVVVHLTNGKFPSSNFLEKNFGLETTGRFYHTAIKILAAAQTAS